MKLPPRLLWIDLETEGLGNDVQILEVALVCTDDRLNEIGFLNQVITPPNGLRLSPFTLNMHSKNGLLADLSFGSPLADVDVLAAGWAHAMGCVGGPAGGSSPQTDVRWLETAGMPLLRKCFNHRVFDVSTLKLADMIVFEKSKSDDEGQDPAHRALADVRYSIRTARQLLGLE